MAPRWLDFINHISPPKCYLCTCEPLQYLAAWVMLYIVPANYFAKCHSRCYASVLLSHKLYHSPVYLNTSSEWKAEFATEYLHFFNHSVQLARDRHQSRWHCLYWKVRINCVMEHWELIPESIYHLLMVCLDTIESMSTGKWHQIDVIVGADVTTFLFA